MNMKASICELCEGLVIMESGFVHVCKPAPAATTIPVCSCGRMLAALATNVLIRWMCVNPSCGEYEKYVSPVWVEAKRG